MIFLDWYVVVILLVAAVYGAERLFVDIIRAVDRRTRERPKPPPSPIVRP